MFTSKRINNTRLAFCTSIDWSCVSVLLKEFVLEYGDKQKKMDRKNKTTKKNFLL